MKNDPFCYPLSYEKLCGDLSGLYSRRINRQHRIVYEVNEEDKEKLIKMKEQGEANGVKGLEIINKDKIRKFITVIRKRPKIK